MPRSLAALTGAIWSCTGAGCSSGTEATLPPLLFAGPPALSVASSSGAFTVAVRFSPSRPVVGLDAAELTVSDAAGAPVTGLELFVVPWMPAHGHGTSTQPEAAEFAAGVYVAAPINFYMPGEWELRTTLSGPADDMATPSLVVQ